MAKAIEKHEFALFIESLSLLVQQKNVGDGLIISDEKIVHRITHVLRLNLQDECILFDRSTKISALITAFVGKKNISVKIQSIQKTVTLQPHITFLLPLLKRDDYETALYALTEVGVNTIQLVFTQKTAHHWGGKKDTERAERIIIAAAEQSKNFAYPHIKEPTSLDEALQQYNNSEMKLFFDPVGKKLLDVMHNRDDSKTNSILLLIGPEGDLNLEEKKLVQMNEFIFCALTPTILRATQAAALSAGFIRSVFL